MCQAQWAYVLEGNLRVTALDTEGGNYIADVEKGDLWYFPAGHPHSLQGIGPGGCEFLLIFDDGNFSEDSTFLLSDWVGRSTPHAERYGHTKANTQQRILRSLFSPKTFVSTPASLTTSPPLSATFFGDLFLGRLTRRI